MTLPIDDTHSLGRELHGIGITRQGRIITTVNLVEATPKACVQRLEPVQGDRATHGQQRFALHRGKQVQTVPATPSEIQLHGQLCAEGSRQPHFALC
ncbi:hypothetical protein D3C77_729240 [compost metagenome]